MRRRAKTSRPTVDRPPTREMHWHIIATVYLHHHTSTSIIHESAACVCRCKCRPRLPRKSQKNALRCTAKLQLPAYLAQCRIYVAKDAKNGRISCILRQRSFYPALMHVYTSLYSGRRHRITDYGSHWNTRGKIAESRTVEYYSFLLYEQYLHGFSKNIHEFYNKI